MTPERHARIQQIFEGAIDLPMLHRISYLDEACRGDPDLRLRVDRLIDTAEVTDTIYEPPEHNAQSPDPSAASVCPRCSRCYEGPFTFCPEDGNRLELAFEGPLLIDSKYHVERLLGRGGMGAVYLARHLGLERRPFALKLILRKGLVRPSYRERFEREARALGRLKHPNIVDVTDYGVDPRGSGLPYLVMEYLEGRTLRQVLQEKRALPFEEAVVLLRAVAEAIDAAHAQNIVHGDLKPSNLFLSYPKNSHELSLKVLDFGLAQLTPVSLNGAATPAFPHTDRETASGQIQGTPPYMAPELLRGRTAAPASDRFAFGVVTYELLTGSTPFGTHLWQVREQLQNGPPAPSCRNPQIPVELDAPVLALLESAPEQRPTRASAAVSAMEQAWLRAEQRRWRARETARRLVITTVIMTVLVLVAGLFSRSRVVRMLEDRVVDARFALAAERPPDPRLLIIALDDATLAEDQHPLAGRADEFGRTVERIFEAGARAVGIDLLLPLTWSESPEFARVVSKRGDHLVLGLFSSPSGDVIGGGCVSQLTALTLGADRYAKLFGFVNLQDDEDGVIRRAKLAYVDREGRRRMSFAGRAVSAGLLIRSERTSGDTPIWIDYSVRAKSIPKISWKDVEARLNSAPELFRGRLILIGADYAGSGDEHRIPAAGGSTLVSGVVVQASIASTIATGLPVRDPGFLLTLLVAGFFSFVTIAPALCYPHRFWLVLVLCAGLCIGYMVLGFWIFRSSRILIAVAAPEFAIVLGVTLAWCVKSFLPAYPDSLPSMAKGA